MLWLKFVLIAAMILKQELNFVLRSVKISFKKYQAQNCWKKLESFINTAAGYLSRGNLGTIARLDLISAHGTMLSSQQALSQTR